MEMESITITKKVEGKDYTITVKKPVAPTAKCKGEGCNKSCTDSTGAGSSLGEASYKKRYNIIHND